MLPISPVTEHGETPGAKPISRAWRMLAQTSKGWKSIARRAWQLLAVGVVIDSAFFFVYLIALQTYLPEQLHRSAGIAGLALAGYGIAKLVFQLGGGMLADHLGVRAGMVLGSFLSLLAIISIVPLAQTWAWGIVGSAVLHGLGDALVWPAVYSAGSAAFPVDERARFSSLMTLTSALSLVLGLGVGTFLVWLVPFDVAMAMPIALLVTAVVFAATLDFAEHPPEKKRSGRPPLVEIGKLLGAEGRLLFTALEIALASSIGIVIATFRAYGRQLLNVSLYHQALLLAPAAIAGILFVGIGGGAADRLGPKRVLAPGFVASGVCMALLVHWTTPAVVVVLAFAAAVGFGLSSPSVGALMLGLSADSNRPGGIIGWFMTADGLGRAVGPAVAGLLLAGNHVRLAVGVAAGLFVLVGLLAAFVPRPRPGIAAPHRVGERVAG